MVGRLHANGSFRRHPNAFCALNTDTDLRRRLDCCNALQPLVKRASAHARRHRRRPDLISATSIRRRRRRARRFFLCFGRPGCTEGSEIVQHYAREAIKPAPRRDRPVRVTAGAEHTTERPCHLASNQFVEPGIHKRRPQARPCRQLAQRFANRRSTLEPILRYLYLAEFIQIETYMSTEL